MAKGKYAKKRLLRQLQEMLIDDCGLSTRTAKVLQTAGIGNMADLIHRSDDEIQAIHGIGEKAMEEIRLVKKPIQ